MSRSSLKFPDLSCGFSRIPLESIPILKRLDLNNSSRHAKSSIVDTGLSVPCKLFCKFLIKVIFYVLYIFWIKYYLLLHINLHPFLCHYFPPDYFLHFLFGYHL